MKLDEILTKKYNNIFNDYYKNNETLAKDIILNESNLKFNHCFYIVKNDKHTIDFYQDKNILNTVVNELKITLLNARLDVEFLKQLSEENNKYLVGTCNKQVLFSIIFYK